MKHLVEQKLLDALALLGLNPEFAIVSRSSHADFQCSGFLRVKNGFELASKAKALLVDDPIFKSVTVEGKGFVNFTFADHVLIEEVVRPVSYDNIKEKIFIDYGGPNIAKPLHVGHMRSAIIGDALKRTAKEIGHIVIGDVHLGDFGTPMGMLLVGIQELQDTGLQTDQITSDFLNDLYPVVAKRFKEDESFAEKASLAAAKLQSSEAGFQSLWERFKSISVSDIKKDFDALGVEFDIWEGESDAAAYIGTVLDKTKRITRESEGALVIDVPNSPPLMLVKSDGGYTYGTTDLATIVKRQNDKPSLILYVVDNRQSLHFKQVFHVARHLTEAKLEHIAFGTINGADGKPYKTRDGGVMRLRDFIAQAIELTKQEAGFTKQIDSETQAMIHDIALGAIKFADLCNPRTSDYSFSSDSVKFVGKTGPYIQYAYVRCVSILKSAEKSDFEMKISDFTNEQERNLVSCLIKYKESVDASFDKRMPHILCDYVYSLAQVFSSFYTECPILHEKVLEVRESRLFLVKKTADTIKKVLGILGIPTPERMIRADED